MIGTGADAGLTTYTSTLAINQLGLGAPRFGVVAPGTAKGTALEEECCANARTIVDGVALDIENVKYQRLEVKG